MTKCLDNSDLDCPEDMTCCRMSLSIPDEPIGGPYPGVSPTQSDPPEEKVWLMTPIIPYKEFCSKGRSNQI